MSSSVTGTEERQTSFGVGGAGNIRKATDTASPPETLDTPPLKGKGYSTGRGGTGNIAKNDPENPQIARKTQDVDVPQIKIAEEQHHVGRGDVANTYSPSDDETKTARKYKEKSRTGSASSSEKPKGVASLAKKGKEVLAGLKD